MCKEVLLNNYQEIELLYIYMYLNNFTNIQSLSITLWNFMEYINFTFFNSKNNMLMDSINIIKLCKNQKEEYTKDQMLAQHIFIYYYNKLENANPNKLKSLIKTFFNIEIDKRLFFEDQANRLKEVT